MIDQLPEEVGVPLGQWARDIADQYMAIAALEGWPYRRHAIEAEAAKYYVIAARMNQINRDGEPS